jgi:hypothetical protein
MAGRSKGTSTQSKTVAKQNTIETKSEEKEEDVKPLIKNITKKKLKLDDDVVISVKSNVFGALIYVNHKTGDETIWENMGDTQPLSVSDLRAMKAKQLMFFKENWITIDGIEDADSDFDDVEVSEIYDALQISQYYKDYICPDNLNVVFNWTVDEIKNKLPRMTKSVKESIAIRANELIKEGILDSISKLKALEEVLGCELASAND